MQKYDITKCILKVSTLRHRNSYALRARKLPAQILCGFLVHNPRATQARGTLGTVRMKGARFVPRRPSKGHRLTGDDVTFVNVAAGSLCESSFFSPSPCHAPTTPYIPFQNCRIRSLAAHPILHHPTLPASQCTLNRAFPVHSHLNPCRPTPPSHLALPLVRQYFLV